jgi:hypothetical protein
MDDYAIDEALRRITKDDPSFIDTEDRYVKMIREDRPLFLLSPLLFSSTTHSLFVLPSCRLIGEVILNDFGAIAFAKALQTNTRLLRLK